jgi:hypothetical protein
MIFQNKQGDLKIAPALTKTNNPSKRNKKPSLVLESDGKIDEPKIVKKGIKVSAEDLTGQNARRKEAKKIDKKMDLSEEALIKNRRDNKGKYDRHNVSRGLEGRARKAKYEELNTSVTENMETLLQNLNQTVKRISEEDKSFERARSDNKQVEAMNNISRLYVYVPHFEKGYKNGGITKNEYEQYKQAMDKMTSIKGHLRLIEKSHLAREADKSRVAYFKKKYAHLL